MPTTARLPRVLARVLVIGLVAGLAAASAGAQTVPRIQATTTSLSSTSDRMISYRHQEHLWQTGDGGLHLMVNRGTLTPGNGLSLWSSYDGGVSWDFKIAFPDTDDESVSDGQLQGNSLSLVVQTGPDNLNFYRLAYDAANRNWNTELAETAYASTQFMGINPGLGIDGDGNTWVVFVARDRSTNDVNLRMLVRPPAGGWFATPQVFGPTDRRSIERSGRLVATAAGMGMVYTVREVTYWAERPSGAPLDAAWTGQVIFTGVPQRSTVDPYASHFGLVADAAGNLHMTDIEENLVQYFRRDAATGVWSGPVTMSTKKSAYSQVGLVNGRPWMAFSVQRGPGVAVSTADGGATWVTTAALVLPADAPGVSYGQSRVEIPTVTTGSVLPILQQYSDNGLYKLLLYRVPAP